MWILRIGVALAGIAMAFWGWEGRSAFAVKRSPLVHLSFDGHLQGGAPPPDLALRRIRLGRWHEANHAFRGDLDEFMIYDYSRSAEGIALAARTR